MKAALIAKIVTVHKVTEQDFSHLEGTPVIKNVTFNVANKTVTYQNPHTFRDGYLAIGDYLRLTRDGAEATGVIRSGEFNEDYVLMPDE